MWIAIGWKFSESSLLPPRLERALEFDGHAIPINGSKFRPDILVDKSVDSRLVAIDPYAAELKGIFLFKCPRQEFDSSVEIHDMLIYQSCQCF